MTSIRGVLLDADGVVQLPRPGWRDSLAALCGDERRADEFLADVFAAERPCLTGHADFKPELASVLRRWECTVEVEDALMVWTQIEPAVEILHFVGLLRGTGTRVALATNQQSYRARHMSEELGYSDHFDHLLYSCELGCAKPSREYFNAAIEMVSLDPSESLFIDDHEANVETARECGLHAEVFHLSEGTARLHEILGDYGLLVAGNGR